MNDTIIITFGGDSNKIEYARINYQFSTDIPTGSPSDVPTTATPTAPDSAHKLYHHVCYYISVSVIIINLISQ
eukprot:UN04208